MNRYVCGTINKSVYHCVLASSDDFLLTKLTHIDCLFQIYNSLGLPSSVRTKEIAYVVNFPDRDLAFQRLTSFCVTTQCEQLATVYIQIHANKSFDRIFF